MMASRVGIHDHGATPEIHPTPTRETGTGYAIDIVQGKLDVGSPEPCAILGVVKDRMMSEPEEVAEDPERGDRSVPDADARPAPPALSGKALVKEVCRLIREARGHWDAHNNSTARRVRSRALQLYMQLTPEQKEEVPQVLRVWLRYRSEKYYGPHRRGRKKKPPHG